MIPVRIPWAEFAPDMSQYNPAYTDAAKNARPTASGWGPLKDWEQEANASLNAQCRGAVSARRTTGDPVVYAIDSFGKLKRFNAATADFEDVTRLSGGDYSTVRGDFVQYGNRLIFCNGEDATQWINVDSGANFAALDNAPIAKHSAVIGGFVVFGNLSTDPRAVQWSAIFDSEDYTPGSGGSGDQPFDDGGEVQGFVSFDKGAIVFQEDKIRIMERLSNQTIFNFRILHASIGCYAPKSIVKSRDTFYWYAQGGFYAGQNAEPIGAEKVNNWIEEKATPEARAEMVGSIDPINKLVVWSVEGQDSKHFLIGYSWVLGKWFHAEIDIPFPLVAAPSGYTFDTWDEAAPTFDELPYTFNSPVWSGSGVAVLSGFNKSGDFGFFSGPFITPELETADNELTQGQQSFVNSFRVISDSPGTGITGQVGVRQFHGDPLHWCDPLTADDETGLIWTDCRGQNHRFRVSIANDIWSNTDGIIAYANSAGRIP